MKERITILHISDRDDSRYSALADLKEIGCEVVSANSPTEGVALLYIMHSVAAVVLDNRAKERASFDVSQSLRKIRPGVPVMLLCSDQIDNASSRTHGCLSADTLTSTLKHLLSTAPVI
jgi:DNA-binding NtrC family response regulator